MITVIGVAMASEVPKQKHSGGKNGGRNRPGRFRVVFEFLSETPRGQFVIFSHDYDCSHALHSVFWTAAVARGYKRGSLHVHVRGNRCYVGRA
jgi:hypothetical protein